MSHTQSAQLRAQRVMVYSVDCNPAWLYLSSWCIDSSVDPEPCLVPFQGDAEDSAAGCVRALIGG